MRNVFFCLLVGILLLGCSEENPSDVFVNSANGESSSSFIAELSSSDITNSSSSKDFAISSSSFGAISNSTEISSSSWPQYSYGELIDERDGQVYKTIKIGEQTWMAENLNYAYSLPTSKKDSSNINNKKTESKEIYGKLYRWSIAMDSAAAFSLDGKGCGYEVNCYSQPSKGVRGVCPENWHIPNESDIKNVIDYSKESNDKLIWLEHYWFLTENEDNEFKTEMELRYDSFWTSEQLDKGNAKGLYFKTYKISTNSTPKAVAYPVRCVKDDEKFRVEHGELIDERDGQVYKTVKIGNQWWMAQNLNYAYTKPYKVGHATFDSASFCYNNVLDSCAKYGRLYAWDLTMDCQNNKNQCNKFHDENFKSRGICPENWHIPSVNEWNTLIDYANHFTTDLKSTSGWLDDGNGSNALGFNLLPAGFYDFITIYDNLDDHDWNEEGWDPSEFHDLYEEGWDPSESAGKHTCFWTPVQWTKCIPFGPNNEGCSFDEAYVLCISSKDREVKSIGFNYESGTMEIGYYVGIGYALSVRCIKDSTEAE